MLSVGVCVAMSHVLWWDVNRGIRDRRFRREFHALLICIGSNSNKPAKSLAELPTPAEVFEETQRTVLKGQIDSVVTIRKKIKELEAKGNPADTNYITYLKGLEAEAIDTFRKWGGKMLGDD